MTDVSGPTPRATPPEHPGTARPPGRPGLVASVRHTVILIAIFLALAAYGAYAQRALGSRAQFVEERGSALPLYLGLIAAEWGLLHYVVVGIRRTGTRMRDLVGARWTSAKDVVRDIAIALALWAVWTGAGSALGRLLGGDSAKSIGSLLPRGPGEAVVWTALSVSAGICEEAVFRGYLQRQFHALTGSAFLAVIAQAAIFGVAHGY
jgi:membrane protease YdiL (CAAX protease family)